MRSLRSLFCKHRRSVHLLAFGVRLNDNEGNYLYRCEDCDKVFWSDKLDGAVKELHSPDLQNDLNKAGG